jgi:transcriptional regulator with XRE-family HTH domain
MASGSDGSELSFKIGKLVEEKGWNQEDFARISHLNRHTVRQILNGGPKRRLRNATVSQCAEAFALTVSELRSMPLDRLLARVHGKRAADEGALKLLYDEATLPDLIHWLERNKDRATEFRLDEVREILEMQGTGGPLERLGVEQFVEMLERRREVLDQVRLISGTEFFHCVETMVGLIAEKVAKSKS